MAALEGFGLSLSSGDLVVAEGYHDGVAIPTATLDAAALDDGIAYAVSNGAAVSISATIPEGSVAVGSCTVDTGAATLPTLAYRGAVTPASA